MLFFTSISNVLFYQNLSPKNQSSSSEGVLQELFPVQLACILCLLFLVTKLSVEFPTDFTYFDYFHQDWGGSRRKSAQKLYFSLFIGSQMSRKNFVLPVPLKLAPGTLLSVRVVLVITHEFSSYWSAITSSPQTLVTKFGCQLKLDRRYLVTHFASYALIVVFEDWKTCAIFTPLKVLFARDANVLCSNFKSVSHSNLMNTKYCNYKTYIHERKS